MTIGQALRDVRRLLGLSLSEAGVRAVIDPSLLSRYEQGKRPPKPEALTRLAEAYNVDSYLWCAMVGEIPTELSNLLKLNPDIGARILRSSLDDFPREV